MDKKSNKLLRLGAIGIALLLMGVVPAFAGAVPQTGGSMAQVISHASTSPAIGVLQNLNQGIIPPILIPQLNIGSAGGGDPAHTQPEQ